MKFLLKWGGFFPNGLSQMSDAAKLSQHTGGVDDRFPRSRGDRGSGKDQVRAFEFADAAHHNRSIGCFTRRRAILP